MTTRRLLIIDDDPEIGRFVQRVAEGCGYEARATERADAFRSAYHSFRPDVIALDLAMPEVDGIELLRFLADEGCRAQLLIISGFDAKVRQAAERLGTARGLRMAGIVPKPMRVADLRALLTGLPGGG